MQILGKKKTITIVPDSNVKASGGAIANDTGSGLEIGIGLKWGSIYTGGTSGSWSTSSNDYGTSNQVNWMDSTSNNFYLAEVQLEVGDKATPFEHRSFSEELQSCRRYFYAQQPKGLTSQATNDANCILGTSYGANNVYAVVEFQTEMRTYPAVSSGGTWYARANNSISFTGAFGTQRRGRNNYTVGQTAGSHSAGATLWCEPGNGSYLYFDAEL